MNTFIMRETSTAKQNVIRVRQAVVVTVLLPR